MEKKGKNLVKAVPFTVYEDGDTMLVVMPGKAPMRIKKEDFNKKFKDCVSIDALVISMRAITRNTRNRIAEFKAKGVSDEDINEVVSDIESMEFLIEKLTDYENKDK